MDVGTHIRAIAMAVRKQGPIAAGDLEDGGKLAPARGLPGGSGVRPKKPKKPKIVGKEEPPEEAEAVKLFMPIAKANEERQEVTGVVLEPETVDAQGDIISAQVIEDAAGDFLENFNKSTKLGLQHKKFNVPFTLRQSFIAPVGMAINSKTVKEGSWVMVVKINDAAIWKKVKEGKITGFSIGGKARVKKLAA